MKEKILNIMRFITSDRKRILVTLMLLLLVGGFFVTLFMYFAKQSGNGTTSSLPQELGTPGVRYQRGNKSLPATLALVVKGNKKSFKVNDTITIMVVGNTSGQIIRGYDAIFRYDNTVVSYIKSKNVHTKFDYQQRTWGDWMMITGAQKMNVSQSIQLKDENLVEMQFKARKVGVAYFPLSFVDGRLSDSNLINDKSEDILTKVSGITIHITQ